MEKRKFFSAQYRFLLVIIAWAKRWKAAATIGVLLYLMLSFQACRPDKVEPCDTCDEKAIQATYNPTPKKLVIPPWLPPLSADVNNPLTEQGVQLGRMLFFDPILSRDSTLSCSGCHDPQLAFTDGRKTSPGIRGLNGTRNAMSLVNLAYNTNGFFWDGRSQTLEQQALVPIEDHLEMDDTWDNVEKKLRRHTSYPKLFREAFGVTYAREISREHVTKALAQFQQTIISGYSRFDRVIHLNEDWFTDEEERGRRLFFFEPAAVNHPGCSHCHFEPLFTDNQYRNNGLDSVGSLSEFKDPGRGKVTGRSSDNGRFRVPTLRNIAQTAPYMHDGRFNTLEEVIDQYSRGGHGVANEDPNIIAFPLTGQQKKDLVTFLQTLTDTTFLKNSTFSNPFQ